MEHLPAPALRPYVQCYWTLSSSNVPHRVLPDGSADLLFDLGAGEALLVGVMTRAIVTPPAPAAELIGVRFRPGAQLAMVGVAAKEARDAAPALRDAWGAVARELEERLAAAPSTEARLRALDAELLARRARATRPPDARVRAAVAAIEEARGGIAVPALAMRLGLGERQLERAFDDHVGVSPKVLARVVRMRAAMVEIASAPRALSAIAVDLGYADQAHMTREFRALAGITPADFARERLGTSAPWLGPQPLDAGAGEGR